MDGNFKDKEKKGYDNQAFSTNDLSITTTDPKEELKKQNDHRLNINNGDVKIYPGEKSLEDPDDVSVQEPQRDNWDSPIEFLLSCISLSVGLGNVWRFPFTAFSNGGGAFLIPYLVVLFLIGRPIYFLELSVGQFCRGGQVAIWNMSPFFKGVGYGTMIGTICVVSYYCAIMAQTVFYFFVSFQSTLPWTYCDKKWGGDLCTDNGELNETTNVDGRTIAQLYYTMEAFPQKSDISDGLGPIDWRLSLCLLLSWTLVFLSIWKGVKSSGKVAYFTALFPYVVIFILLIRGVTLPGAWNGIRYFIEPQWGKLLDPKVWYAAVGQCFFSLSTAFGPIIMFASYNPFRHNVYRDAMVISITDTVTSCLAGCTIFAVLGHLSYKTGKDIPDVTEGGPGLAFVSYPEAIAQFTWVPQLFAVLFFLMLFTLGIGSATALTSAVITVICDNMKSVQRWKVTLVVCILGFFSGLMYVTEGGGAMVDLIDSFGSNFVIYLIGMLEVGAVSWAYGLNNFCKDLEFMLNRRIGWYWRLCWAVIMPLGLFVIFIYAMATQGEMKYNGIPYPASAVACGWALAAFALLMVPAFAVKAVLQSKAPTLIGKIKESMQPNEKWGPANPLIRKQWEEYKKLM